MNPAARRPSLAGVNTSIMPASIAAPAANYAHAVLSSAGSRLLHTSGVVPIAPDGSVPDDLAAQVSTVWSNIGAMLDEAGMRPADVLSVTTYVVEAAIDGLGVVMAERDRFLGGHRAASTLLVVPRLAQLAWKMEIAVVAAAS